MRALIALLKRQKDTKLLLRFIEYDVVYKQHKKIVAKAREYRRKKESIPIALLEKGIESKLDLVRLTLQMMQVIFTYPAVVKSGEWNIRHAVKKYNLGLWDENAQVRLCATISAAMIKMR